MSAPILFALWLCQDYVATRAKILKQPIYTSAVIGGSALMMTGLLVEVQCCAAVTS